ncbi:DNA glycosylase AlkZ-like family protein [Ornithinimicrobium sp. CNJ-824]|uniref:DNA glycosylase AlkZ-like family protein n=1 Tax=Ornithinimicrobium sp. CNJ-824 TaxID=1904966 RepID=UPI00406C7DCE
MGGRVPHHAEGSGRPDPAAGLGPCAAHPRAPADLALRGPRRRRPAARAHRPVDPHGLPAHAHHRPRRAGARRRAADRGTARPARGVARADASRGGCRARRTEVDGRDYWHLDEPPADEPAQPRAHLLQVLDETYRGFQESRWLLDERGVVPRGRERSLGMVLLDGQLVASWRDRRTASTVRFEVSPHRALAAAEVAAVEEAAQRYAAFLGLAGEVSVATG